MPLTFPAIMGSDFAGTVTQVGAQVIAVRPGTQVYGTSFDGGTYAEYLRVAATGEFAALPASLDVVHAAALPMAGMTALGALDTAALAKGAVLLIVGGAGGLGTFAIQMAARMGAHVIATARTEDQEYIRSLGAAETVDFTKDDVVEAVRTSHPGGVDAVLDVVSGSAAIGHVAQALRTGGRLLSTVYAVDAGQGHHCPVRQFFHTRDPFQPGQLRRSCRSTLDRLLHLRVSQAPRLPWESTWQHSSHW